MMYNEVDKIFIKNTHHVPLSQIVPEIRPEKEYGEEVFPGYLL